MGMTNRIHIEKLLVLDLDIINLMTVSNVFCIIENFSSDRVMNNIADENYSTFLLHIKEIHGMT